MSTEVIASLTTAAGTLVLAVATFVSTRSANRAARVAERSLLVGLQPVLMHARMNDEMQKVGFSDDRWVRLEGPGAAFEVGDEAVYLAVAVRNVGSGIAVLQGWRVTPERILGVSSPPPLEEFRPQNRDLYIAPSDLGFWQGALRDQSEAGYDDYVAAANARRPITVDLLYSDLHGHQRTITRFAVMPAGEDRWISAVNRHWMVDGISPRQT